MPAPQEREYNLIKNLLARFERHPVVEVPTSPEVPQELKTYVEKVETGAEFKPPSVTGGPATSAVPQQPNIVLPLTPSQYAQGKKAGIFDSIRWLAEWCLRLFKIYGPRAIFRSEPNL